MRPAISLTLDNLGDLPLYRAVLDRLGAPRPLPFVEIVWDGYCHLDPHELLDLLAPLSGRISFHVMRSKFLQRTGAELELFLDRLAEHVRVIQPVRVSDHLARFRIGKVNSALPLELPYRDLDRVCRRVARYQDRIRQPLLLENYASTEPCGERQADYLAEIQRRTGCGLLFDVSNAVVAELNGVLPLSAWNDLLAGAALHCHVGGYRLGRSGDLFHDSHDSPLSRETLRALGAVARLARVETVCYERDQEKSLPALVDDMQALARALEHEAPPSPPPRVLQEVRP